MKIQSTESKYFSASAWPYTQRELEQSKHDFELTSENYNTVNIDCAQMGVGGDNSWGMPVHNEYMLNSGKYSFSICIDKKNN